MICVKQSFFILNGHSNALMCLIHSSATEKTFVILLLYLYICNGCIQKPEAWAQYSAPEFVFTFAPLAHSSSLNTFSYANQMKCNLIFRALTSFSHFFTSSLVYCFRLGTSSYWWISHLLHWWKKHGMGIKKKKKICQKHFRLNI